MQYLLYLINIATGPLGRGSAIDRRMLHVLVRYD